MSAKTYQKYLFVFLSLVYMLPFSQNVVMTVVAKDVMRDLVLTPDMMGVLGSTYLYGYAASMLLSGALSGYFGPRRFLAGMFFISGAGGLIFSHADSFALACAGRALSGVGSAVVLTSSLALFARWYSGASFSRLCSLFFSVGGLGAFLGSTPLAVANVAWGWRTVFFLVAVLTLFYGVMALLTVRDWPPPGAEDELGVAAAPRQAVRLGDMVDAVRRLARSRDFWKLVLWFVGMSGMYLSFVGLWIIPYLKDVHGLSDVRAGGVVSLYSLGFIVGGPALTWICDKWLRSNRIALGMAGVVGLCSFLPLYFAGEGLGVGWLSVIALVMGMCLNSPNALVYSSARNIFGSRITGMASGAIAGFCFVSGAVLQVICGLLMTMAERNQLGVNQMYLYSFAPFVLCFILASLSGFTLSRESDPGHISAMSWRFKH